MRILATAQPAMGGTAKANGLLSPINSSLPKDGCKSGLTENSHVQRAIIFDLSFQVCGGLLKFMPRKARWLLRSVALP